MAQHEPNYVSIYDIDQLKFDDWKKLGNLLDLTYENVVNEYYAIEYNKNNPPYYHCLPLYNEITGDKSHRFLLIKIEQDYVFVAFKIIQIMTTKLIKIIDKPISKFGLLTNETDVIFHLRHLDYIKFTYKEKYACLFGSKGKISEQDCDYYYDYDQQTDRYTKRYLVKNHFNRFENGDFSVSFTPYINLFQACDLYDLRKTWENTKTEQGIITTPKTSKFMEIINRLNGQKNALFLNIYYKDKLVLNYCYLVYDGFAVNLFRQSISRTSQFESDNTWLNNTFSRLDKYAVYVSLLHLHNKHINMIYYGGARPSDKTLMEYKKNHSNGRIEYFTQR